MTMTLSRLTVEGRSMTVSTSPAWNVARSARPRYGLSAAASTASRSSTSRASLCRSGLTKALTSGECWKDNRASMWMTHSPAANSVPAGKNTRMHSGWRWRRSPTSVWVHFGGLV
ncbi:hypothetical protein [Mycobacterium sp. C31M]